MTCLFLYIQKSISFSVLPMHWFLSYLLAVLLKARKLGRAVFYKISCTDYSALYIELLMQPIGASHFSSYINLTYQLISDFNIS